MDPSTAIDIRGKNNVIVIVNIQKKSYQAVLLISPKLITGSIYSISIGEKEYEIEMKEGRNIIIINK